MGGQVGADSLTLLASRPPGVRSVTNPLPAAGAADAETMNEARENAPRYVRTLGRIVSLQDYQDFAQVFAGIGKAQATKLWRGTQQVVYLTIAAADGEPVSVTSDVYTNLLAAIQRIQVPNVPVEIDTYQPVLFNIAANIMVDSSYLIEDVIEKAKQAVEDHFAFEKRAFGQNVSAAEVIAVIQGVEGVVYIDLDALTIDDSAGSTSLASGVLIAKRAYWDQHTRTIQRTELLLLNPAGLTLTPIEVLS
jgi:predicted phage baseplate assembly protein